MKSLKRAACPVCFAAIIICLMLNTFMTLAEWDFSDTLFIGDSRTKTMATGGTLEFRLLPDDNIIASWGACLISPRALVDAENAGRSGRKNVVFWYGVNDVQTTDFGDFKTFIKQYDELINIYLNAGGNGHIYILSVLNTSVNEKDYYEGQDENIRNYNIALNAFCEEKGYTYVDITDLQTGDEDFSPGDYIHFSVEWYTEKFLPRMDEVLHTPEPETTSEEETTEEVTTALVPITTEATTVAPTESEKETTAAETESAAEEPAIPKQNILLWGAIGALVLAILLFAYLAVSDRPKK